MNWLPSLRALLIFAVLMLIFAALYWACAGRGKMHAAESTTQILSNAA